MKKMADRKENNKIIYSFFINSEYTLAGLTTFEGLKCTTGLPYEET